MESADTDVGGSRAEMLRDLHDFLIGRGASEDEISRAQSDDLLDLLVADRLLLPSPVRYNEAEVAEMTGMPVELARRFWRALGFPDPSPDDRTFTDLDIEAIKNIESMVEMGVGNVDTFLQLARVVGSSMARIADAEVSPSMLALFAVPGSNDSVAAADRFARVADKMLPATGQLLEFVWRRHVHAAVRRAMTFRVRNSGALPELCVGFADMVGFTMLSQQLSEDELAALVSRFEDVAHDVVTSLGGRVVKMIGDEVMFVTDSTTAAARIGLTLAETYADDELLSDVRVALAVGPVLVQDGDYYGPVVNLANRVADIAQPGSVLVTDDFHGALTGAPPAGGDADVPVDAAGGFDFRALRPRIVKDFGRVQLWSLYRTGSEPHSLDRRLGRRWERLSEVLHEIDDLRERGEKLISVGLRAASQLEHGPSPVGAPEGGDAEGPQGEAPVETGESPPPEVD
jgi:adenylate cyclase